MTSPGKPRAVISYTVQILVLVSQKAIFQSLIYISIFITNAQTNGAQKESNFDMLSLNITSNYIFFHNTNMCMCVRNSTKKGFLHEQQRKCKHACVSRPCGIYVSKNKEQTVNNIDKQSHLCYGYATQVKCVREQTVTDIRHL